MSKLTYRGYEIYFDPPPVPTRAWDWHYVHKDYDGPGDRRCGDEGSVEHCKQSIDELVEELAVDELCAIAQKFRAGVLDEQLMATRMERVVLELLDDTTQETTT